MTPDALAAALRAALPAGDTDIPVDVVGRVRVVPAPDGPGWRSPLALVAAPSARMPPATLAASVAERLARHPAVASATVLGDGMLDVVLTPVAAGEVVARILGSTRTTSEGDVTLGPRPGLPAPGRRRPGDPAFLALWAHARAVTLVDQAARQGFSPTTDVADHLARDIDLRLLTALAALPDDAARAVARQDAAGFLRRVVDLATRTHAVLDAADVVPRTVGDPLTAGHGARIALVAAAGRELARGLRLLDLPTPDRL